MTRSKSSDSYLATQEDKADEARLDKLTASDGQPLCKHYTGAKLGNLTGDYSCKCFAGIPYERWTPMMERWPCRRRHILGLEQHQCPAADYGSEISNDVDKQVTEMTFKALEK